MNDSEVDTCIQKAKEIVEIMNPPIEIDPVFKDRFEKLSQRELHGNEVLVVCHHCGCPWICVSAYKMVSCPSCGGKTRRVKDEI